MRSNNLLTLLLYALLLGLVVVGGYKACEMRKEKADLAKQDAEMKKYWSDMGSPAADSSTTGGSTYASGDTSLNRSSATITPSADGIERDEQPAPTTGKTAATTTAATKTATPAATKPAATIEVAKPAATKPAVPKTTAKGAGTLGLGSGRYSVRVGSFSSMENARTQLEKVIRLGYPNATIGKTNGGKFATVVVFKSNNKAAATRIMDKLEEKGVDALVHDGN